MNEVVFNSLGANYTGRFAWTALMQLLRNSQKECSNLEQLLARRYNGTAWPFYKGRDAIEFALRVVAKTKGYKKKPIVFTQAFACYAIEEAILRAGWQPAYVDIASGDLNPSIKTL